MQVLVASENAAVLASLFSSIVQATGTEPVCVTTAEQALRVAREAPVDLALIDAAFRAPRARSLLAELAVARPQMGRVALCSTMESRVALRWLPEVHQVLPKGAPDAHVAAALRRVRRAAQLFDVERVAGAVGRLGTLPTIGTLYQSVQEAIDEGHPARAISTLVERDPTIAARILRVANSAAMGLANRVTDLHHAVTLLGLTRIRDLVLAVEVAAELGHARVPGVPWLSVSRLHEAAIESSMVVRQLFPRLGADASTGALFHLFGRMLLVASKPRELGRVVAGGEPGAPLYLAEQQQFGASAAEIGAWMLWTWGVPEAVVTVVQHHDAPAGASTAEFNATDAVHVAAGLVAEGAGQPWPRVDEAYFEERGWSPLLEGWRGRLTARAG